MLSSIHINARRNQSECRLEFTDGFNTIEPCTITGSFQETEKTDLQTILMLAIDYAFGGNDFSNRKRNPAILFMGELDLEFSFVFDNSTYHFSRSSDESSIVINENYMYTNYKRKMSIREYQRWLSEEYALPCSDGFLFYDVVGRFFRMNIEGRDNLNSHEPLRAKRKERSSTPLRILELLFSRPDSIDNTRRNLEDYNIEKGTYDNAIHYGIINIDDDNSSDSYTKGNNVNALTESEPSDIHQEGSIMHEDAYYIPNASNKEYWKKSEISRSRYSSAISKAESLRKTLSEKKETALKELDEGITRRLDDIDKETVTSKRKMALLYERKLNLQSQIKIINDNLSAQDAVLQRDIDRVRRYFPDADLRHIEEVNDFHNRLKTILSSEMQEELSRLSSLLNVIESEINGLTEQLKSENIFVNLSSAELVKYEEIVSEAVINDEQYKLATKGEEIFENYEKLKSKLSDEEYEFYNEMRSSINNGLAKYGIPGDNNPWIFELDDQNKTYYLHRLNGCSSEFKYDGLIFFDLSLLDNSTLPVAIHCAEMFERIPEVTLTQIKRLYSQCNKQVFVYL